ncbi:MAG: hypothetical protein HGA45_29600 [Chloroflexales bacterium]|nr:hypothetical protein [Chloroflexales bacterium]
MTPAPDLLRTATRLVVGSLLLVTDAMALRAPIWEQLAQSEASPPPMPDGAPAAPVTPEPGGEPEDVSALPAPVAPNDSQIVLAAIGWLAVIPEQLGANGDPRYVLATARVQLEGTLGAFARGSLVMASRGRLGPPTMLDDPDLKRWITLGQIEAQRSRTLASVAIISIVREAVAYLASEPAVQQIVQEQGTTLATDVLGEVREYTVSGDTFVDGLVRRFFGRRPRTNAPAETPPPIVVSPLEEG